MLTYRFVALASLRTLPMLIGLHIQQPRQRCSYIEQFVSDTSDEFTYLNI
jgi:hypothetical protein